MSIRLVMELDKECAFCNEPSTHSTVLSYGFFDNNFGFYNICKEHAKKINRGEFGIRFNGVVKFFETRGVLKSIEKNK